MQKAFTLIELLIVIAILGVLAVVVIIAINPAKQLARARDAGRITSLRQIERAIRNYMLSNNGTPPVNKSPGFGYCSNQSDFLDELVESGELASMPQDPSYPAKTFCYYNYGGGIGPIITTLLEGIEPTIVPPEGTCRPFTNNWCSSTNPNTYYCICLQ